MQIILFTPPSDQRILDGTKTMTARFWKRKPPKEGALISAQTGYAKTTRFAILKVLKVWEWDGEDVSRVLSGIGDHRDITEEIAKKEGFESIGGFCETYYSLNAHNWHDPDRTHWFIEFELQEATHGTKNKRT